MENQATVGRYPAFQLLLRSGEKAGDEVVSAVVNIIFLKEGFHGT
jgi:hypothetical protein